MAYINCDECYHAKVCLHNRGDVVVCKYWQPTADVVEVVRCEDCAYRRVAQRCSLWMGTTGDTEYFREHGDDFYCAFGTPKGTGGD